MSATAPRSSARSKTPTPSSTSSASSPSAARNPSRARRRWAPPTSPQLAAEAGIKQVRAGLRHRRLGQVALALCADQGRSRSRHPRRHPDRHHPAPLDHVRTGGWLLHPLCRTRADEPVPAADRRSTKFQPVYVGDVAAGRRHRAGEAGSRRQDLRARRTARLHDEGAAAVHHARDRSSAHAAAAAGRRSPRPWATSSARCRASIRSSARR